MKLSVWYETADSFYFLSLVAGPFMIKYHHSLATMIPKWANVTGGYYELEAQRFAHG